MAATAAELLRAKARREQAVRGPSRNVHNGNNGNVTDVVPRWGEAEALRYLHRATDHLAWCYPDGAWLWAERDRPDLLEAVHAAETVMDDAFRAQDRAAFWRAVDAHEATVRALFEAYRTLTKPNITERPDPPAAEPVQLDLGGPRAGGRGDYDRTPTE